MEYRRDIDGLRSLAIIPVLAYHGGLPPFQGGFAGVDVFFVISGFLITGLIADELDAGTFSLSNFYQRRLRRLIPALYLLLALAFGGGLLFLTPEDLVEMAKSGLASLFFASNVYFLQTTDYFSQAAEFRPLLHTWSLAVEEQFYLFWPFLISAFVILTRARRIKLAWIASGVFVLISLLGAALFLPKLPLSVFYLVVFRLWELGVGGLLALTMRSGHISVGRYSNMGIYGAGLALVLGSMLLLSKDSSFPGVNAVPVVLGTAMMLSGGQNENNFLASVFRSGPLVYIGKLSYGLYLFHWPLFAYYRNYQDSIEIGVRDAAALLAVTFSVAALSYHFLEHPIRRGASKKAVLLLSGGGAVAFVVIFSSILLSHGIPQRIGEERQEYAKSRNVMNEWPCSELKIEGLPEKYCIFGAPWEKAERRIILWGDSHAKHFAPLIDHVIDHSRTSVLLYSGAPFIDDENVRRWQRGSNVSSVKFAEQRRIILNWLPTQQKIDMIVMATAWSGYPISLYKEDHTDRSAAIGRELLKVGLHQTILEISGQTKILILSDFPRPGQLLTNCLHASGDWILRKPNPMCRGIPKARVKRFQQPVTTVLKRVSAQYDNVDIVDVAQRFCGPGSCDTFINGRLLYMDTNHIRRNLNASEKSEIVRRLGLVEAMSASTRNAN